MRRPNFLAFGLCLLGMAPVARAGEDVPGPVWIFLKDKGFTSTDAARGAIDSFQLSLSPDAIRRRELRGVAPAGFGVGMQDLPVAASYASMIGSTGADIRVKSAWLNAISVQASPQQLARIRALPFVDHLQPVVRFSQPLMVPEPLPQRETTHPTTASPTDFYGASSAQLNQIKIPQVHALGYTGAGIKIGLLDTGFLRTHEAFNFPGHPINVLGEHDFLENDSDTSDTTDSQHQHGTYVLGCIGAYQPNVLVGGAYNASFLLAKTEDITQEVPAEEDYWVAGLEYLENSGADIVTSSLGYINWYSQSQLNGHTAVTTVAALAAATRGLPITNAAGNEGHDSNPATSHLLAPADADLLITVGAVDVSNLAAGFSSDGPTADGRVKPEVMARGVDAATVTAFADSGTTTVNGTSFSTPLTASAVALIIQAHPNWSVEQLRYALFNTASRGGVFDPLYVYGYGVIDTLASVQFSFDKFYISPSSGNWDIPANWSGSSKPLNVSDVFILPSSAVTVFGPNAAARVHSLTIDAQNGVNPAILQLAGNTTFTIDKTLSIGTRGALTQINGSLFVNGSTANNGGLNINSAASVHNITGSGSTNIGTSGNLFADSIRQQSLNLIGNGHATIRPNGTSSGTSVVKSISIDGGASPTATLDLTDNALVIDHSGTSPLATISSQIKFAYHNGAWDRAGITSSLADASTHAIGFAERSLLGTVPAIFGSVDNDAVLIRLTRYGDADLNGAVNLADFNFLAGNFGIGTTWLQGDFNYDGMVNLVDFNLLAANFGLSASPDGPTPQDWADLASAVPEPSTALLTGIATSVAMCFTRIRRRRAC